MKPPIPYENFLKDLKPNNTLSTAIKKAAKEQGIKLRLSKGEERLAGHLNHRKIAYVREYQFHPVRKWKFDFAFPEYKIAVEVEGGGSNGQLGRHQRHQGFENDCIKYNSAAKLGWMVLRYSTALVINGVAIADIEEILGRIGLCNPQ